MSAILILLILFVSTSHAVAINKQAKTAETVSVEQTVTDKLANIQQVASIAYTSMKPFNKNETKMECVVKAENMIGKLGELTKDAIKAQIVYDQDPDSDAGQDAEANIKDANFAQETSKLTKAQILNQAATSMLAQANASKQTVLALLQN